MYFLQCLVILGPAWLYQKGQEVLLQLQVLVKCISVACADSNTSEHAYS